VVKKDYLTLGTSLPCSHAVDPVGSCNIIALSRLRQDLHATFTEAMEGKQYQLLEKTWHRRPQWTFGETTSKRRYYRSS